MGRSIIKKLMPVFLFCGILLCMPSLAYAEESKLDELEERISALESETAELRSQLEQQEATQQVADGTDEIIEIDLNEFLTANFTGYDGYGTIELNFAYVDFGEKYNDIVKLSKAALENNYNTFAELFVNSFDLTVSSQHSLSNGDKVSANWDIDYGRLYSYVLNTISISAEPKIFTVTGLEQIETFDAFEGVSIEFEGISPNVTASISLPDEDSGILSYSLSQKEDLSIGDTLTVMIDEESAEQFAKETGKYPEQISKDYMVEKVPYYVTTLDDIPEENLTKMRSVAEDKIGANAADWKEKAQLDSFEYCGCYFLYCKPDIYTFYKNITYLIYEIQATQYGKNPDGSQTTEAVDYYWYIGFYDGIVLENGLFSLDYNDYCVPSSYSLLGSEAFSVETYDYTEEYGFNRNITLTYAGYKDYDSLFNHLVTQELNSYTYESTVK